MMRFIALLMFGMMTAQISLAAEKQVPLTAKLIESAIEAQGEFKKLGTDLESSDNQIKPEVLAKLNQIAIRTGFTSFDHLDTVVYTIVVTLDRLDSQGKYITVKQQYQAEIESIKNDSSITPADKKELIAELEDIAKTMPEVQFEQNIALVLAYRQKIFAAL